MDRNTKLRHGDWVQHQDGRKGSIQSYGYCGVTFYGDVYFAKCSRVVALERDMPAVFVWVGDQHEWWTYNDVTPIPAPLFGKGRAQ